MNQSASAIYTSHLAEVNNVKNVVATQDVLSSQGQIILPRGEGISKETYEKIANFKLEKPIENSVAIEDELTASTLYEQLVEFLDADRSTAELLKVVNDEALIRECCQHVCAYSILRQKITVLSIQLPAVYEQSIFCAWVGSILLHRMGVARSDVLDFFAAAMCHDLGMLHIAPEVLAKTGDFSHEDWRQIQCHPIIGYNVVVAIPNISKSIAQTVLEHQEQLDGTGYPLGKLGDEISASGQLLGLLDTLYAIYNKHFKKSLHTLKDVLPIIQMNVHGRYGALANKLIMLLRVLPDNALNGIEPAVMPELIRVVKERTVYITDAMELAEEVNSKLGFRHDEKVWSGIQNAVIHISTSMVQSGIINDAYLRWLDQVQAESLEFAYLEVGDAFIMMSEVIYQLDKLKRQIRSALSNIEDPDVEAYLEEKVRRFESLVPPEIPAVLSEFWVASET